MFMRRQLKSGRIFQMYNSNDNSQSSTQNKFKNLSQTQLDDDTKIYDGDQKKSSTFTGFNPDNIASQNAIAILCCGGIICLLCAIIFSAIFYFFIFDHVKYHIPFLSTYGLNYLTQKNAKQYFAINQLIAGELHYPRIPVQYWSHRIDMVKSMGMNALSVYVFWNYHEIQKGKFDFQTKNKNLTHFLQLCKQKQMKVLLRPGPFTCAQWDLGGLPSRLFTIEGIKLRSSNYLFIEQTRVYFEQLSKVIKNYILNSDNPSGPILMLQVQNEPAWYTNEALYISRLKDLWDDIGLNCPLYFDQTTAGLKNSTLYWQNAIIGMNPEMYDSNDFDIFKNTNHFVFGGQVYAGWFTSWGGVPNWQKRMVDMYVNNFASQFSSMLRDGRSFSLYLAHGGTNFGMTGGYNQTTSYDYFAPISQQGRPSPNYHVFRSILMNYKDIKLPSIPDPIQTMQVNFSKLKAIGSIFDNLPNPINSTKPLAFESEQLKMFNQGLVLYQTTLEGPYIYNFDVIIHDVALVFVDGKFDQQIVRTQKKPNLLIQKKEMTIQCKSPKCKLEILVEPMGHVNFGAQLNQDRKGILLLNKKDNQQPLNFIWNHYTFDLSNDLQWINQQKCQKAPCLYQVQFDLQQAKDTYINVKQLKKGYLWVNGYNLGRYWDIGPQYSLYCPGPWLNKGKNKIVVLDLFDANAQIALKGQYGPVKG